MTLKKPSDMEEEYFLKEDLEKLKALREKLDREREQKKKEQEKNLHFMHCPKCGEKMEEVPFRNVMVDKCPGCGYIGFDAGELELVAGSSTPFLTRFFKDLQTVLGKKK